MPRSFSSSSQLGDLDTQKGPLVAPFVLPIGVPGDLGSRTTGLTAAGLNGRSALSEKRLDQHRTDLTAVVPKELVELLVLPDPPHHHQAEHRQTAAEYG